MGGMQEELLRRLLETFRQEAEERLASMSSALIVLEKAGTDDERTGAAESLFRDAHSMKGAARAVNMTGVESASAGLEEVFSALKRGRIAVTPGLLDKVHGVVDAAAVYVAASGESEAARLEQAAQVVAGCMREMTAPAAPGERTEPAEPAAQTPAAPPQPPPQPAPTSAAESGTPHVRTTAERPASQQPAHERNVLTDTVRISSSRLDLLLRQAEEMLALKLIAEQRSGDLRTVGVQLDTWDKRWEKVRAQLRPARLLQKELQQHANGNADKASALGELIEFLDWAQQDYNELAAKLQELQTRAEDDARTAAAMVEGLLEDVLGVAMLPVSTLLELFPKVVRDLSRDMGKDVDLVLGGGEVELDKRILEIMKTPLLHLVRNSMDHGIELPQARERAGKPRQGRLAIEVSQVGGGKVEIAVSDDGAGINIPAVKAKAVALGFLSQAEADELDDAEAARLIFHSELSTSPILTDLSGRGLGMPIVRQRAEELGGGVTVESAPGKGACFRIRLPLTVATSRGVLVTAAARRFIIPTISVSTAARIPTEAVKTVENTETVPLGGQTLALVRLADVLQLPAPADNRKDRPPHVQVLVVAAGGQQIALAVDGILNEQEVLVKSLGHQLKHVRNVSGATVLGSGQVVPILNVGDLVASAVELSRTAGRRAFVEEGSDMGKQSILVVEDSVTSRMFLKSVLESAGYDVHTAVDGVDALSTLKTSSFDLVVSDVEMPRMNGFDLVARIRADESLASLPVIMVTSLESREDRERGIDVGANAYIVKSSFDQGNLLEAIGRLI